MARRKREKQKMQAPSLPVSLLRDTSWWRWWEPRAEVDNAYANVPWMSRIKTKIKKGQGARLETTDNFTGQKARYLCLVNRYSLQFSWEKCIENIEWVGGSS
jgi:hypothetical protein